MTPEQEAAQKLADTVLENLDSVRIAFEYFDSTYRHGTTAGLRDILDAGRDYERRKYMG